VYLGIEVREAGQWRQITDDQFRSAGLEPSWEYDGESAVAVYSGNRWFDCGTGILYHGWVERIPYHRFLSGDRERAIALAVDATRKRDVIPNDLW
jgi:hypothetical protein